MGFQEDIDNKSILLGDKEVDLNKIFTPAADAEEHIIKKDNKFGKIQKEWPSWSNRLHLALQLSW